MKYRFCVVGLILAVTGLGVGCGPEQKPGVGGGVQVQPVTAGEVIARLNARALAVQQFTGRGKFALEWKDKDGNHRQSADARLMIQRPKATTTQAVTTGPTLSLFYNGLEAKVALFGSFSGSEVFEMGVNTTNYWMAFRTDPKKAYVGRVRVPDMGLTEEQISPLAADMAPFRADRVLEMLGLSYISYDPANTGQVQLMQGGAEGSVTLMIRTLQKKGDGVVYRRQRELVIDTQTDEIREIKTYKLDNSLEADIRLSDYSPIKSGKQDAGGHDLVVMLPARIEVEYPGREAKAELILKNFNLKSAIPEQAFVMPDFAQQELEVIKLDDPTVLVPAH